METPGWEIVRYDPSMKEEWDSFITESRNATFLFQRDYMDYHSHLFTDHSLLAYRNGHLTAVLPANITENVIHTHQGLTYGGWALSPKGPDTADIYHLWRKWLEECQKEGIEKIIYKPLPYIYAGRPSQEDLYLLFLLNSKLIRTDISTAIDLTSNPGFNKLQRRHLKGGEGEVRIELIEGTRRAETGEFYEMLAACLKERHTAEPVHTLKEIETLVSRFPKNIKIWVVRQKENNEMMGGVMAYDAGHCVHCQYICTTPEGRRLNVLASLFNKMITHYTNEGCRYFDFGISNENEGRSLNTGLNRQKTSYGGTGVVYQRFEINVSSALESLPIELWPPK